jgi:hypothetical protein
MSRDFLNDTPKHQIKTAAGLLRELRELTPIHPFAAGTD